MDADRFVASDETLCRISRVPGHRKKPKAAKTREPATHNRRDLPHKAAKLQVSTHRKRKVAFDSPTVKKNDEDALQDDLTPDPGASACTDVVSSQRSTAQCQRHTADSSPSPHWPSSPPEQTDGASPSEAPATGKTSRKRKRGDFSSRLAGLENEAKKMKEKMEYLWEKLALMKERNAIEERKSLVLEKLAKAFEK